MLQNQSNYYGYYPPAGNNMMPPFGFETEQQQYNYTSTNFYPDLKNQPNYSGYNQNQRQGYMPFVPESLNMKQNDRTILRTRPENLNTINMPSRRQWTQNLNRINFPNHNLNK